jgi:hypothetical protein
VTAAMGFYVVGFTFKPVADLDICVYFYNLIIFCLYFLANLLFDFIIYIIFIHFFDKSANAEFHNWTHCRRIYSAVEKRLRGIYTKHNFCVAPCRTTVSDQIRINPDCI